MDTRLLAFKNLIRFFTKGDTEVLIKEYNDLFCLFLSQLVYFSPTFILKNLTDLGAESVKLIEYDGPMTVCIHIYGISYVSIKGLSGRNKKEWPIALNFLPKDHEGLEAHGGFVMVTRKLLPSIKSFVSVYTEKPVVLTGHSMGGGIAILVSLSVDGCKVVTFGSPKTVTKNTGKAFDNKDMMHYGIDTDLVTYLPPGVYVKPGIQVIRKRKFSFLRFWDNHTLNTYSSLLMPVIATVAIANSLNSDLELDTIL